MKHRFYSLILILLAAACTAWAESKATPDAFEIVIECLKNSFKTQGYLPVKIASPLYAGYYTEWVNGSIVDSACKGHVGERMRFSARIERSTTERFPEQGWGIRSGRLYETLFVRFLKKIHESEMTNSPSGAVNAAR